MVLPVLRFVTARVLGFCLIHCCGCPVARLAAVKLYSDPSGPRSIVLPVFLKSAGLGSAASKSLVLVARVAAVRLAVC